MYMLMEQKKIYGEINNKEAYQRILKEIVQKVQNYQNFHNNHNNNKEEKENDKSRDLEHKIDDIVEKTFEKMNISNLKEKAMKKQSSHEMQVVMTSEDEEQQ